MKKTYTPYFNQGIILSLFIIFIVQSFYIINSAFYGIDLTDESYYILNALNKNEITAGVSSFGFYTSFLFKLFDGDLPPIRIFSYFSYLLTTSLFSYSFCYFLKVQSRALTKEKTLIIFITLFNLLGFIYFENLTTPNYNHLNLISILLILSGLFILVEQSKKKLFFCAVFLIGFGGSLSAMVKPTATLLMLPVALLWLLTLRKRIEVKKVIFFTLPLAIILLLSQIILFHESLNNFTLYLKEGSNLLNILGAGHGLSGAFKNTYELIYLFIFQAFVLIFIGIELLSKKIEAFKYLSTTILIIFPFSFLFDMSYKLETPALIAYGLFILLATRCILSKKKCSQASVPTLLFISSLAYVFGTNNSYPMVIINGALLIGVATFTVSHNLKHSTWYFYFVGTIFSILAIFHTYIGVNSPYRSQKLTFSTSEVVNFPYNDNRLRVSKKNFNYINGLRSIAFNAGWEKNTPLLDLTGGTPGASIILQAQLLAVPWHIGGYKGSDQFILRVLELSKPEDISRAWLLSSPLGSRSINSDLVNNILGFPENYINLGDIESDHRNERQILWKRKVKP